MRIVLDTNVLVSGLLKPAGPPGAILNSVLQMDLTVLFDDRILSEYRAVLTRPAFGFDAADVSALLEFINYEGEYVAPGPVAAKIKDPGDVRFYEVAVAGSAEYLVTGNRKHFPDSPIVNSPAEFIEVLRSSAG